MIINTNISYGYHALIETFFKANDLDVTIQDMAAYPYGKVVLEYDENSETAFSITFMSVRHLGFENMLCDYLIRCGIPFTQISTGSWVAKRDMKELDKQWEEHRKLTGLR